MRAKNFDETGIKDAIRLCRSYSIASHVAINTRLRDRELPRALEFAAELYEAGADAFIVADLGLAALIKRELPDVSLHASTQLTGTTPGDAEILKSFGFERMVCPRELSFDELRRLARSSSISIEAFVHGAHCASVSGQCLMSWAMGGRSGNRGECAQPCRLPFEIGKNRAYPCREKFLMRDGKPKPIEAEMAGHVVSTNKRGSFGKRSLSDKKTTYPLSLKDMCLASHIPELIETGVASLKIEGRLKSPDYVYGVTKIYRRLLDERRAANMDEIRELEAIFSRGGFTDGYFTADYSLMCGTRDENAPPAPVKFTSLSKKMPLTMSAHIKTGEPASLAVTKKYETVYISKSKERQKTIHAEGDVPEKAKTIPLTEDLLYRGLSKLGSTPYALDRADLAAVIEDGPWMTAAQINELRRRAISELDGTGVRKRAYVDSNFKGLDFISFKDTDTDAGSISIGENESSENNTGIQGYTRYALFRRRDQIPDAATDYFDVMFLPYSELPKSLNPKDRLALAMDPFSADDAETEKTLSDYASGGGTIALVSTMAQLAAARRIGISAVASFRFNLTNTVSAAAAASLGADAITLSPELPTAAMSGIALSIKENFPNLNAALSAVVYGKLPLMLLRRCVLGSTNDRFASKLDLNPECRRDKFDLKRDDFSGENGRCGRPGGAENCPVGELIDRKGTKFPVIPIGKCMNEVVNSCPIWSADSVSVDGLDAGFFIFTDEDKNEVKNVVTSYIEKLPPAPTVNGSGRKVRRM